MNFDTEIPPLEEFEHLNQLDLRPSNDASDTPSTATAMLATPGLHRPGEQSTDPLNPSCTIWIGAVFDRELGIPSAPVMRDFDSFTDGTGAGSFDCLSEITASGDLFAHPAPLDEQHLAQLYTQDHMHSIAMWREDVVLSSTGADDNIDPTSTPVADATTFSTEGDVGGQALCKRPRSLTSDDGQRRTRVKSVTTTTTMPCDDAPSRTTTRRERSGSAPPIFSPFRLS